MFDFPSTEEELVTISKNLGGRQLCLRDYSSRGTSLREKTLPHNVCDGKTLFLMLRLLIIRAYYFWYYYPFHVLLLNVTEGSQGRNDRVRREENSQVDF